MSAPSVTYTFSNSTTADASQVNSNFTDLINGLSDGTKDLTVSALQTNGNTTLGNATGDDVTITGSLASSISIKTQYSYDVGTALLGLRKIYFGSSDSAGRGTSIGGGTVASNVALTLPVTDGEIGHVMRTDGSGVLSFGFPFNRVTKTTTYTLAADVTHIDADATAGAFTITIPAAASALAGQTVWIRKTDSTFSAVTLGTGVSTTLNTLGEAVQIQCDGSAWAVINRVIPSVMTAWTPSSTQGFGTVASAFFFWARVGDRMRAHFKLTAGTVTGSEARISFPDNMPASDTTKMGTGDILLVGSWARATAGATTVKRGTVLNTGNTAYFTFGQDDYTNAGSPLLAAVGTGIFITGATYSFVGEVPITGWNG